MTNENLVLLLIVAQFKHEKKVIDVVLKAGAGGATFFHARGTGVRQKLGFLGQFIQSEKSVVLAAVPSNKSKAILEAVHDAAKLNKPGNGFTCVLKLEQADGLL